MDDLEDPFAFLTPAGGWRITGTRVSLDSVIHAYWEGKTPQAIVEEWPTLTVEKVQGAIAFYLHNRRAIDRYLRDQDGRWEKIERESREAHSTLIDRVRTSRRRPRA